MSIELKLINVCRTCANNLNYDELIPLFPDGAINDIKNYQNSMFQVLQNDGLPQQICAECLDQFNEMNEFIQKCEKNQLFWEKAIDALKNNNENSNNETISKHKQEENLMIEELLEDYDYDCEVIKEDLIIEILTDDIEVKIEESDNGYINDDTIEERTDLYDEIDVAKELEKAIRLAHENELEKKTLDIIQMKKFNNQNINDDDDDFDILEENNENIKNIHYDTDNDSFNDLSCELCPEKNMSFNQLQEHIKYKHKRRSRPKSVMCEMCGEVVRDVKLKSHMNNHLGIPNETKDCEICGKAGLSIEQFKTHSYKHGTPTHFCEYCKKGFRNIKNLQSHYELNPNKKCMESKKRQKKDNPKASLQCLYCMKKFLNTVSLVKHCRTHRKPDVKNAKHICSYCGAVFKRADHLKIHVNSQHLKTEEFKCQLCDKVCYASFRLNLHMKNKHLNIPPRPKCEYCNKSFSNPQCVRRHQLEKHSTEKLHKCPICGENFFKYIELTNHSKIHDSLITNELQKEIILKEFCPNVLDNSSKKKRIKSEIAEEIEIEEVDEMGNYTIYEDD